MSDKERPRGPDKGEPDAEAEARAKYVGDESSLNALRERLGKIAETAQHASNMSRIVEHAQLDPAALPVMPEVRTARAAETTAEAMLRLLEEAEAAERRERTMLHWTRAGVVLAGIAAAASVLAIVLAVMIG